MLVEVLDVQYWTDQIDKRLVAILGEPQKRKLHTKLFFGSTLSDSAVYNINKLRELRDAFTTVNIGKIYLSEKDLNLIGAPVRGKRI